MSEHNQKDGVVKSFTLTAFLGFVVVFCFLVLMAQCHGDFHPGIGTTMSARTTR